MSIVKPYITITYCYKPHLEYFGHRLNTSFSSIAYWGKKDCSLVVKIKCVMYEVRSFF